MKFLYPFLVVDETWMAMVHSRDQEIVEKVDFTEEEAEDRAMNYLSWIAEEMILFIEEKSALPSRYRTGIHRVLHIFGFVLILSSIRAYPSGV